MFQFHKKGKIYIPCLVKIKYPSELQYEQIQIVPDEQVYIGVPLTDENFVNYSVLQSVALENKTERVDAKLSLQGLKYLRDELKIFNFTSTNFSHDLTWDDDEDNEPIEWIGE